ncbi:MAG TPA: hypothetical protein VHK69_03810 [Chitinophagaceae bacterium]|jgi:uncharacterized membrane protein YdfJ with MMPL/SSD domain|nr:hypothetical protein [Chitinophagaceae bacterium]
MLTIRTQVLLVSGMLLCFISLLLYLSPTQAPAFSLPYKAGYGLGLFLSCLAFYRLLSDKRPWGERAPWLVLYLVFAIFVYCNTPF